MPIRRNNVKILITGADGFIAKNLILRISEHKQHAVLPYSRANKIEDLAELVATADAVIHLAGVNRPQDPSEFRTGNADLTIALCDALRASKREVPVIYSSSIQAAASNPYGQSKLAAEEALRAYATESKAPVYIYRLPNVFGKWARPNYNSAIATFCHNIVNDLPITIHDATAPLTLVYVDDVIDEFLDTITHLPPPQTLHNVRVQYKTTVGEVAETLRAFKASVKNLVTEPVGTGLIRALYSTYVSYLPPTQFSYEVPKYGDPRGEFVEMLKTHTSGQFSYFTAHPGVTRGGHYHHSKTEKFLVIRGDALFRFRHMISGETYELRTQGGHPQIVDTVPGWTHDITNVGDTELVVMLWANEIFDRARPDTISAPLPPLN